jgi:hypothetical protein
VPIGSSGFFALGEEKARFDQQPVEAAEMSAMLYSPAGKTIGADGDTIRL